MSFDIRSLTRAFPVVCVVSGIAIPAQAQSTTHDAEDGSRLEFSHPLVAESPTPDTKWRLDYTVMRTQAAAERTTEQSARVEGEYAFAPFVSLAATAPYVWRRSAQGDRVGGMDDVELSLKLASSRWSARGIAVGGGLSAGLPTGDAKAGIGSSRAVELAPFADVALARGNFEIVAFGRLSTMVHTADGEPTERNGAVNASVLYHAGRSLETLLEVETIRPISGSDRALASSIALGIKLSPFSSRRVMVGVSAPIGLTGEARHQRGLLVSAFYHL